MERTREGRRGLKSAGRPVAREPDGFESGDAGRMRRNTLLALAAHLFALAAVAAAGRGCAHLSSGGGAPAAAAEEVVWVDPEIFSEEFPEQPKTPLPELPKENPLPDPPGLISEIMLPRPAPTPEPSPAPEATPSPTPKPAPPPAPKPTPTPAPKPTPKPTPKPSPSPSPKPKTSPSPKASPKPSPKSSPKPSPKASPKASPSPAKKSDSSADADKKAAFQKARGSGGGGSGSSGGGTGAAAGPDLSGYHRMIRERFYDRWVQPQSVFRADKKLVAVLTIRIEKSGRISGFNLVESSGDAVMDQSVLEAARRVVQIDPLPPGLNKTVYEVDIEFELQ